MGDYVGDGASASRRSTAAGERRRARRRASAAGGFTYGDFGKIVGGPEVHADGEIWAQTLWDLRARARLGRGAARLITRRDAAHAARAVVPGRAQRDPGRGRRRTRSATQIWDVFAARGMGYYASTTGSEDVAPVEDFAAARAAEQRHDRRPRAGRRDRRAGSPGATVGVGGSLDLRPTTGADGRYTINAARGARYANVIVLRARLRPPASSR